MSNWTIVTTVYNEYALLRQLIESIQHHVDPNTYEEIIVLDDYSKHDGKLREYENYLKTENKFNVITYDQYRYMAGYQDELYGKKVISPHGFDYRVYESDRPNMCHAKALTEAVKHVKTEFVLCVDIDIIFLQNSKDLLIRLEEQFRQHDKAMICGQAIGIKSSEIRENYEKFDFDTLGRSSRAGGQISSMGCALRMDIWNKHNLGPIFPLDMDDNKRMSGAFNRLHIAIFESEFCTLSYPIYSEKNLFHVGKGVAKPNIKCSDTRLIYGFCNEFVGKYGSRFGPDKLTDYQTGSHIVNMGHDVYKRYMIEKFEKTSFIEIQPPIDESLIVPVEGKIII